MTSSANEEALARLRDLQFRLMQAPADQKAVLFWSHLEKEPPEYRNLFAAVLFAREATLGGAPMPGNQTGFPPWAAKAGFICGAATLIYFMAIVAFLTLNPNTALPPSAGFLLSAVLALGVALSFAFLGGDAAAKGRLSLPRVEQHPVEFSVAGGIGVFVIVFLLAINLYPD